MPRLALALLLLALAGCVPPCCEQPPAAVAALPTASTAPAPQVADCRPSLMQPEPGAAFALLARIEGCPDLVMVQQGGVWLFVPRTNLISWGTPAHVLDALPLRPMPL